jgi:hypothetical protein
MPADLTTALGALLADSALRDRLRRDPEGVARALQVGVAELQTLDPEDLERQAEGLIAKRFYEVRKRLPRTLNVLNPGSPDLFKQYAQGPWPEGHHRHVRDAANFAAFLDARGLPVSRSEWNRVKFHLGSRRAAIHYVPDVEVGGRRRRALQLLFRFRGSVRSCAFYLGF